MNNGIINQNPYLRSSREFPHEGDGLPQELSKAYIEIAQAVNDRVIGLFTTQFSALTGETWYFPRQVRQQTLRQIYQVAGTGSIKHNIDFTIIAGFTNIYGTFTDTATGNWYPLPYIDVVNANNQVNVKITSTDIVITGGGGAGQPAVSSGFVVLEWLAQP